MITPGDVALKGAFSTGPTPITMHCDENSASPHANCLRCPLVQPYDNCRRILGRFWAAWTPWTRTPIHDR